MLPKAQVVLIGDLENTTYSEITEEFFDISEEEGFIVDYSKGKPKSFVLTGETIYLSMISSTTLGKRMKKSIDSNGRGY